MCKRMQGKPATRADAHTLHESRATKTSHTNKRSGDGHDQENSRCRNARGILRKYRNIGRCRDHHSRRAATAAHGSRSAPAPWIRVGCRALGMEKPQAEASMGGGKLGS